MADKINNPNPLLEIRARFAVKWKAEEALRISDYKKWEEIYVTNKVEVPKPWDETNRKYKANELSKPEFLHHHRELREYFHRLIIQNGFSHHAIPWNCRPGKPWLKQHPERSSGDRLRIAGAKEEFNWAQDFWELSNKSIPFYALAPAREGYWHTMHDMQRKSIGSFLYAKWFCP